MWGSMTPEAAIERVVREHSARILATLVRVFGARNFELAEDVLQEAFRKAVVAWELSGVPDDPAAWILTAAKRQAIDVVRAQRTHREFSLDLENHLRSDWTLSHTIERSSTRGRRLCR
jgi:RNA polymerase sigma-70 factor (ECF subfamily)